MDIQIAILVILTICVLGMIGILVIMIMLGRVLERILKSSRERGAGEKTDLKPFNELPEEYKVAVNHIVENVLGYESPDMNDAFRMYQAEIYVASSTAEQMQPNPKLFEIEALSFRGGWERRQRISGVPS